MCLFSQKGKNDFKKEKKNSTEERNARGNEPHQPPPPKLGVDRTRERKKESKPGRTEDNHAPNDAFREEEEKKEETNILASNLDGEKEKTLNVEDVFDALEEKRDRGDRRIVERLVPHSFVFSVLKAITREKSVLSNFARRLKLFFWYLRARARGVWVCR